MKLTSESLKKLIKEVLDEGRLPDIPGVYRNPFTGEDLTPEQKARLDQPLDLALDTPAWFLDLKMRYKAEIRTPEEKAAFADELAQRERDTQASIDREIEDKRLANQRLDQDRMDYLKTTKAAHGGKFPIPGPDGEMTVRGVGVLDDEPENEPNRLNPSFTRGGRRPTSRMSENLQESLMYEGDDSILALFEDAVLEEGGLVCGACLFETLQEASCGCPDLMGEAVYQGRTVKLNKPTRGDVKKFKVYVNSGKKDKKGRIKAKKVNFGDKNMKIKKSNPKRRASFRARHNCKNPGPKTKARYWSCKKW